MIDENIFNLFNRIGKDLSLRKLISSHAGNISIRDGNKIIIKKRASMLGWLTPDDLIECSLDEEDASSLLSSTETIVHRSIYLKTDALAVIHAHSPYCIALSLLEDEIKCIDAEGAILLKKIPVIELNIPTGASEAADKVPPILANHPVVVIRSHGIFAKGISLEDALQYVTAAEHSAMILYLTMLTGKTLKKDYSKIL
ncbi:MAG TPA: class II aldolase/adducin family protein [Bacteroidales bacterium]|nr:class II aldolase/adducin family protein [Bacteroidales bacterium]